VRRKPIRTPDEDLFVRRSSLRWVLMCVPTYRRVQAHAVAVLTQQRLDVALPGTRARSLTGFGSFRIDEFRIAAWHQVFA
jgi:limonene-1,2-epoxide hydrolase